MQPGERLGDEIDASLFEDDDGQVYFLWHSGKIARHEIRHERSGRAVSLAEDDDCRSEPKASLRVVRKAFLVPGPSIMSATKACSSSRPTVATISPARRISMAVTVAWLPRRRTSMVPTASATRPSRTAVTTRSSRTRKADGGPRSSALPGLNGLRSYRSPSAPTAAFALPNEKCKDNCLKGSKSKREKDNAHPVRLHPFSPFQKNDSGVAVFIVISRLDKGPVKRSFLCPSSRSLK